jgi:protease I
MHAAIPHGIRREAMNERRLDGKRVAILATDGVEQVELLQPREALQAAGAKTMVIAPYEGTIKGWDVKEWGQEIPVDATISQVNPNDFDGLLLPGGVMNPDKLRVDPAAVSFVRTFFNSGKPIATICHGPWTLVEADVVRGRTFTSWPSLQTDIRNAGGQWVDQEVVTDRGLVSSRKPDDIPAFNRKMIEEFAEGVHQNRMAGAGAGQRG